MWEITVSRKRGNFDHPSSDREIGGWMMIFMRFSRAVFRCRFSLVSRRRRDLLLPICFTLPSQCSVIVALNFFKKTRHFCADAKDCTFCLCKHCLYSTEFREIVCDLLWARVIPFKSFDQSSFQHPFLTSPASTSPAPSLPDIKLCSSLNPSGSGANLSRPSSHLRTAEVQLLPAPAPCPPTVGSSDF